MSSLVQIDGSLGEGVSIYETENPLNIIFLKIKHMYYFKYNTLVFILKKRSGSFKVFYYLYVLNLIL